MSRYKVLVKTSFGDKWIEENADSHKEFLEAVTNVVWELRKVGMECYGIGKVEEIK